MGFLTAMLAVEARYRKIREKSIPTTHSRKNLAGITMPHIQIAQYPLQMQDGHIPDYTGEGCSGSWAIPGVKREE